MPSNIENTVSDAFAAVGGLKSAADKIHDHADSSPGGPRVKNAARMTANILRSTADYGREKDVGSMIAGLARLVKNNPGPAMLCAAACGFLVARGFSDD